MGILVVALMAIVIALGVIQEGKSHRDQPLSRIAIHKTVFDLNEKAYVKASPTVLGSDGEDSEWVLVDYSSPHPSDDDWIGVFSPADFNASICPAEIKYVDPPLLCSAPIKFQYANYSNPRYIITGNASLKLQLINQRADFSFGLFTGGLLNPNLVAISNTIVFENPKAPVYPRLALGKEWDEHGLVVTYGLKEAEPVAEWGIKGGERKFSPVGTLTFGRNSLTFGRNSMCGAPARTVGWRIHTHSLSQRVVA